MDLSKIEQAYTQYGDVIQQAFQLLDNLITKMREAAANGDDKAAEWADELQKISQTLQGGQSHIGQLLQQFHGVMSALGNSDAKTESGHSVSDLVSGFLNTDAGKSIQQGAMAKLGENFLGRFFKS